MKRFIPDDEEDHTSEKVKEPEEKKKNYIES
jgi:hypothetical protein